MYYCLVFAYDEAGFEIDGDSINNDILIAFGQVISSLFMLTM